MSPAESHAQNDVAALERAILQEAQKEARQILADAQIKADGIRRQAEEAAKVEGEAILQQAQQEAETLLRQTVAKAQLEAQMLKLKRREQILEHTFAGARQRLTSVTTWPDYDQIVQHLIREAAQRPGSDAEFLIQVDAQTQQVLTEALLADLEKELEVHLRLGEPLSQGTGVVLRTSDGHHRYDNTLETRLARAQEALRTPVYHILMGETP